jgi:hypothetical protein
LQGVHIRINYLEDFFIKRHVEWYENCILKIRNDRNCMAEPTETVPSWCPLTISIALNLHICLCGEGAYCFLPCASKEAFWKFGLVPSNVISNLQWSYYRFWRNFGQYDHGSVITVCLFFQWNLLVQHCIYLDSTLYESVDVQWSNLEWREAGIIIYWCDPFLSSSYRKFLIRRRKAIMRVNSPTNVTTLPSSIYQNSS